MLSLFLFINTIVFFFQCSFTVCRPLFVFCKQFSIFNLYFQPSTIITWLRHLKEAPTDRVADINCVLLIAVSVKRCNLAVRNRFSYTFIIIADTLGLVLFSLKGRSYLEHGRNGRNYILPTYLFQIQESKPKVQ